MTRISLAVCGLVTVCALATACGSVHTFFAPTTPVSSPPLPPVAAGSLATLLTATPWQTVAVRNPHGDPLPLTDPAVRPYLGFVCFRPDSTFTAFGPDDTPGPHGTWWLSPDGKTRTMITTDDTGKELSRSDIDVVILTATQFIDRVRYDPTDRTEYYDVVRAPTDHRPPGT